MAKKLMPASTVLRAAAFRAAVATEGSERDDRLSHALMASVYRLADGTAAIRFCDGRCRLSSSHQGLTEWYEAFEREAARGFSWESVLPSGTQFPHDVPRLVGERAAWMRAGVDPPDIAEVERAIRKLGQQRTLTADVFPHVVAHVGEAIRARIGGAWATRDRGDGPEPCLVLQGGKECPLTGLYKHILEHDKKVSIQAFIEHMVWSRGG